MSTNEDGPMAPAAPRRAICVFCGSAPGARPAYVEAARSFGTLLARQGLETVYGGGHVGMMGAVADAALAAGGKVTGIIPRHLMRPEVAHPHLSERLVVGSMHERKLRMAERANAFAVLPGGFGTFDEMFEMVTWQQLGLQDKPVGILNVAGYFDPLLAFLRHVRDEGFVSDRSAGRLQVETDGEALLQRLLHPRSSQSAGRG